MSPTTDNESSLMPDSPTPITAFEVLEDAENFLQVLADLISKEEPLTPLPVVGQPDLEPYITLTASLAETIVREARLNAANLTAVRVSAQQQAHNAQRDIETAAKKMGIILPVSACKK